jgi:hypothetical protein
MGRGKVENPAEAGEVIGQYDWSSDGVDAPCSPASMCHSDFCLSALIYSMTNAVIFGSSLVTMLLLPNLRGESMILIPIVVGGEPNPSGAVRTTSGGCWKTCGSARSYTRRGGMLRLGADASLLARKIDKSGPHDHRIKEKQQRHDIALELNFACSSGQRRQLRESSGCSRPSVAV